MSKIERRSRKLTSEERPAKRPGPKKKKTDYSRENPRDSLVKFAEIMVLSEREGGPDDSVASFLNKLKEQIGEFHAKHVSSRTSSYDPVKLHDAAWLLYSVIHPDDLALRAGNLGISKDAVREQTLAEVEKLLPGFGPELLTPEANRVLGNRSDRVEAVLSRLGEFLDKSGLSPGTLRKSLQPLGPITTRLTPEQRTSRRLADFFDFLESGLTDPPRKAKVVRMLLDAAVKFVGLEDKELQEFQGAVGRLLGRLEPKDFQKLLVSKDQQFSTDLIQFIWDDHSHTKS